MAYRVTDQDVRDLTGDEAGTDMEPWIRPAEILVTRRCAPLAYSPDELAEIERWLAAHFRESARLQLSMEKIGQSEERILARIDLGLDYTRFGQQARIIDYLGGLVGVIDKRRRTRIIHLADPLTDPPV